MSRRPTRAGRWRSSASAAWWRSELDPAAGVPDAVPVAPRTRIDLHTHTNRSDGVLAAAELHRQMVAAGMALVAITDHDTLAGVAELRAAGLGTAGPVVITGIEINTVGEDVLGRFGLGRDGEELHLLGYGLDAAHPGLAAALERQRAGRRDRIALTLERVREQGMRIELDLDAIDAATGTAVGRPHVARALVAAGYATDVSDAFAHHLGHGCPCYVPRQGLGPREAIEAIAGAGGIPVLAHSPDAPDRPGVIDELVGWGLRGLEVYYHRFDAVTVERMAAFAAGRGLLATGGSDYHGDGVDYAGAIASLHIPDAVADALLAALAGRPGVAA
jgi:3',5'-nucleoside bisphosphate phosphatase